MKKSPSRDAMKSRLQQIRELLTCLLHSLKDAVSQVFAVAVLKPEPSLFYLKRNLISFGWHFRMKHTSIREPKPLKWGFFLDRQCALGALGRSAYGL